MRTIDAEALKKEIESLVAGGAEGLKDYYENGSKSDENAWIGGIYDAWELIDQAPTVEPERPHGKWIEKIYTEKLGHGYLTHHDIVCSVCGGSGENDEGIFQNFKFCPNCGADMRGDNDGKTE